MGITEKLQVVGPYQVDRCLHFNGTMGSFRCFERETNLPVAVHVVPRPLVKDPAAWTRFCEEIGRLRTLPASRVALPLNVGEDQAHFWVAYEWINGRHLGQCVHENGLPDVGQSLQMIVQSMEALSVLHERGVVHRMVTPNAIFLNELQSVKLIQAGWGTFIMSGVEGWALNPDFMTRLPFLAPEVVRFATGDERADVYSLGAMLYFLLTGYPTLWADEPQQLLDLIFKGKIDFTPLRQVVPDTVSEVVEEMCSRDPEDRPANFPALRDRLQYLANWYLTQSRVDVPTQGGAPTGGDRQAVFSQASDQPGHQPGYAEDPEQHRAAIESVRGGQPANLREAVAASTSAVGTAPASPPPVAKQESSSSGTGGRTIAIVAVIGVVAILLLATAVGAYMLLRAKPGSGKPAGPKVTAAPAAGTATTTPAAPKKPDTEAAEVTKQRLQRLGSLNRTHFEKNGIWAMRLGDLKELGATVEDLKDDWGNDFELREKGYIVSSSKDGKFDNDDDIWYDGESGSVGGWTPAAATTPPPPTK